MPARPRLLVPGLVPRDPARERHRVRRGAATAILLEPDDRLTVRDLDGGQRAEVTVVGFGTDGFDGLGVTADGDATILRSLVGSGEDDAAAVVAAVAARGADPSRAKLPCSSAPRHRPGAETTLRAERPLLVVVGAPASGEAVVDGGVPASDLELEIARAQPLEELEARLRSRSPTRGSTSRSTAPPRSPTR